MHLRTKRVTHLSKEAWCTKLAYLKRKEASTLFMGGHGALKWHTFERTIVLFREE